MVIGGGEIRADPFSQGCTGQTPLRAGTSAFSGQWAGGWSVEDLALWTPTRRAELVGPAVQGELANLVGS